MGEISISMLFPSMTIFRAKNEILEDIETSTGNLNVACDEGRTFAFLPN